MVRAAETDANEVVKAPAPDKAPVAAGSSINQILGIKGAKQETDIWKIRVQLTKPVTWPPLIWGVVCGAAASGTPLCINSCKINDGVYLKPLLAIHSIAS
ncbi:hypothetical protein RHSIM_Rhsim04G0126400 [Rhododendron simsii]|uniref:Uncharacterized protein n=1 Tax=Rhododendron simsii TaxID=118357 RepID=A0A834H1W3_RHOSS|nr:hypothetical protein RHSIM_Rhsim04G0126400 [Rhododendron simsii]